MKLLLFSDLHVDIAAARKLTQMAQDVDVVVCAGDLANVRRHVDLSVGVLRGIDRPTVLVAGNNESTEELTSACHSWPSARVLHGSGVTIEGVPFFGMGGAVPVTPFGGWSYDLTEEEADRLLASCPDGAVLVTHSPPRGTLDVSSGGQSLGSEAVLRAIQRHRPRLAVCGHIHACAGRQAWVGSTPVVNAGPGGILWDLADPPLPS